MVQPGSSRSVGADFPPSCPVLAGRRRSDPDVGRFLQYSALARRRMDLSTGMNGGSRFLRDECVSQRLLTEDFPGVLVGFSKLAPVPFTSEELCTVSWNRLLVSKESS